MELLIVFIRIILAVLVGKYAEGRGRSFGWAFFLSLLISPLLMWIIYALMSKKNDGNINININR